MDTVITCLYQSNQSAVGHSRTRPGIIRGSSVECAPSLPGPVRRAEGTVARNDPETDVSRERSGDFSGYAASAGIGMAGPQSFQEIRFAIGDRRVIAVLIVDRLARRGSTASIIQSILFVQRPGTGTRRTGWVRHATIRFRVRSPASPGFSVFDGLARSMQIRDLRPA